MSKIGDWIISANSLNVRDCFPLDDREVLT